MAGDPDNAFTSLIHWEELGPGAKIVLGFPITSNETEEQIDGRSYAIQRAGDTVASVEGASHPIAPIYGRSNRASLPDLEDPDMLAS